MPVLCKGCGNTLVTSAWTNQCVFCGRKANAFRAGRGSQVWTRRGAVRVGQRKVAKAASARYAMTWQEAEIVACEWMRKNGYRDAALTSSGADGGIDIVARKAVAQVKHHSRPVGVGEVQRLSGIARATGKRGLFFSAAGFTPKAAAWARDNAIEMYRYPPVERLK